MRRKRPFNVQFPGRFDSLCLKVFNCNDLLFVEPFLFFCRVKLLHVKLHSSVDEAFSCRASVRTKRATVVPTYKS